MSLNKDKLRQNATTHNRNKTASLPKRLYSSSVLTQDEPHMHVYMKHLYKKIVATIVAVFSLMPAVADDGQTLYGYVLGAGAASDTQKFGFVSFSTSDPSAVTFLKTTMQTDKHLSAAEYLDGKIYAYTFEWSMFGGYESATYNVYDAATYQLLGTVDRSDKQRVVDMTYDYTTNTMYALAEDEVSTEEGIGRTSLCIVDLATGDLARVGSAGDLKARDGYNREVDNSLVTLAADDKGNLYSMSEYRYFFKLDKRTGKATQVGERHNLATNNEFQSMTFGLDGTLYWAQKHPDYGWLTTIDPATGEVSKLGTVGDNYEVSGLCVPRTLTKTFPSAVTGLTAANDPTEHHKVTLAWTLPANDYAGNATTLTAVQIYRLGTADPVATLDGTTTSFVDESAPDGYSTYEVVPVNATAPGTPATVKVFAGYDQLDKVGDLVATHKGKDVTLSWTKPTATVNGEYADYDNITYNVYRVDLASGDYVRVSEKQAATTYTETLPGAGVYTYVVEAVSGGVVGLGEKSNNVEIEDTYTIPYSTGFEDDDDGLFWKTIDNPEGSSYGWSIALGYSYQRLDGKFAQFKTGSSSTSVDAWLVSPAIHMDKGTYQLQYSADGGSYNTHTWEVKLGYRQLDPDSYSLTIDSHENAKVNGWADNTFTKEFSVPADGNYYLGLHGTLCSSYATLKIDKLSITAVSTGIGTAKATAKGSVSIHGRTATIAAQTAVEAWTLTNVRGQVVATGEGNGTATQQVGLSALPAGLYVMAVKTADGSCLVQKIVVGK